MKRIALMLAAASLVLVGCSEPDPCLEAKDVSECQAWADAGGDVNDYLLYGMAGYLIGSSTSGKYIYKNPSYRGTYHPAMASKIGSQQQQIARLERKVQAQKAELKRQQTATSSSRSSSSRSSSSFRSMSSSRSSGRV